MGLWVHTLLLPWNVADGGVGTLAQWQMKGTVHYVWGGVGGPWEWETSVFCCLWESESKASTFSLLEGIIIAPGLSNSVQKVEIPISLHF